MEPEHQFYTRKRSRFEAATTVPGYLFNMYTVRLKGMLCVFISPEVQLR
jgi:hypothetical protein